MASGTAAATCTLVAVGLASANPSIASKQGQAQAVLAEIQASTSDAEQAANQLYAANQELKRVKSDLQVNERHLSIARASLRVAQQRAAARLRALYMSGDSGGLVAVLLGSESLDAMLNQLDAERRVSALDATVLREVKTFRADVRRRQSRLVRARSVRTKIVAERTAAKQAIDAQLDRQRRLLASIHDEIAALRAAEERRQALLAKEARQRYLAAQQALRERTALAAPAATSPTLGLGQPYGSPPPPRYGNVVAIALQYLGIPYVWGGESPATGFDCSGLVAFVYAQVGVYLPHNAAAQYGYGVPVARDQLEPGDLVFFDDLGHVGLYVGGGNFEQAPQTGDVVKITSLDDPWASSHYYGARRIV